MSEFQDLDKKDEQIKMFMEQEQRAIRTHQDRIYELINDKVLIEIERMERRRKKD